MSIRENIRIAAFSIRTNLMRSLLTMLGIIIGVASVIAILTLGNGGRDYIVQLFQDMSQSSASIAVSSDASNSEFISREDIEAMKKLPSVEYASPVTISIGTSSSELVDRTIAMTMSGTEDLRYVMDVELVYGRFYTAEEYKSGTKVAMITPLTAQMLFGYVNCIGEHFGFTLNGQSVQLKVIGIVNTSFTSDTSSSTYTAMLSGESQMSGGSMAAMFLLPGSVVDALMGTSGYYELIYIKSYEDSQLDSATHAVINLLYTRHGNFGSDVYTATNMMTYVDLIDKVIDLLTKFIAGVSGISLVVGGIGVMNIMLVSVTERTREIGIRKALGARTATILLQFLTESIILCLIGGVLGFAFGVAGAMAVSFYIDIPVTITFSTIAISIGFSSAIGIFFGIYPARRAAKMPPIEALRRE